MTHTDNTGTKMQVRIRKESKIGIGDKDRGRRWELDIRDLKLIRLMELECGGGEIVKHGIWEGDLRPWTEPGWELAGIGKYP